MDGGPRQEKVSAELKQQIKEHSRVHGRRGERILREEGQPADVNQSVCQATDTPEASDRNEQTSTSRSTDLASTASSSCHDPRGILPPSRLDGVLLAFYLNRVFPLYFPFYRPRIDRGGHGWMLELMLCSPLLRQATIGQSAYFLVMSRGRTGTSQSPSEQDWEAILTETQNAFQLLRQSFQVIDGDRGEIVEKHIHGAVRIMTSILQIQRFETVVANFDNCRAHLDAASALFESLLNHVGGQRSDVATRYNDTLHKLGAVAPAAHARHLTMPSAEQLAFEFSAALLIYDDVICSTLQGAVPRVFLQYSSLLEGREPTVDIATVLGCPNWVIAQIGAVAEIDSWRAALQHRRCLDYIELVKRATLVKEAIELRMEDFEQESSQAATSAEAEADLCDIFTMDDRHSSRQMIHQGRIVTRIWAHAALLYLSVVVSGWQPENVEVRRHVTEVATLLHDPTISPAVFRTLIWPFCVAGCLADSSTEGDFRSFFERFQSLTTFGTFNEAVRIVKDAWLCGRTDMHCSFSDYFQNEGRRIYII